MSFNGLVESSKGSLPFNEMIGQRMSRASNLVEHYY